MRPLVLRISNGQMKYHYVMEFNKALRVFPVVRRLRRLTQNRSFRVSQPKLDTVEANCS